MKKKTTNKKASTAAETILDALNLDAFEPEERLEMLLSLSDIIFRGSMLRLMERMDEPTREEFSRVTAADTSGEAVSAFIAERVPDADEAVQETVDELAADIHALGLSAAA